MPSLFFLTTLLQTADVARQDVANQFNNYLVLGYFVMWLIAMVYIVSLAVRQRNLQKDLRLMGQILEEEEK
ncbi:MAG: hypothetical protein H6659_16150 [Ardenticatenaceae bacterium]|nr:hypothetical protein [Anaerolineales bacterium]MCB8985364.1 hypothetical protein [Ardenticatenaceae bacterium]MCB8988132.1 hypothetical protein [Ardenticatenaceae bacterium]